MGGGSWSDAAYGDLKKSYKSKSTNDVFANTARKTISSDMDPKGLSMRESRDSEEHPNTLAVMVYLDETGSMGRIPDVIAREKLGNLMGTLVDNGVDDAQIMFSGIGDHITDDYPLQVGQFESDTTLLDKWLTSINLEGYGGGQTKESYLLAWLVAGRHSSIDCFEKRGEKGFLFTIGDEMSWENVSGAALEHLMGYENSEGVDAKQLLIEAQRMYHVFHIHCTEGANGQDPEVMEYWKDLLNERLILLDDHTTVSEVIAGIVASMKGADINKVTSRFDDRTALMVRDKVNAVTNSMNTNSDSSVVTL